MAHFAKIDENNIVTQVLVIDQETINTGHFGDPNSFVQTSYNTRGGVHYGQDGQPDNGVALRKNYAGIGYTYDPQRDAFYAPQPYNSWTLNEETCYWEAPTPMPTDGKLYTWDEDTTSWVEIQPGV
jgi:hypothetical protein